jgi:signal transduction histidine kinase
VAVSARLLGAVFALGVGAGALAIAAGPGRSLTYAGRSGVAATLFLAAGLTLAAAGLMLSPGTRSCRIAALVVLASVAWFAPAFVAWQNGPPLARSLALIFTGFALPLVAHVALAYPGGRADSPSAYPLLAAMYLEAVVAAFALALFRDPYFDSSCRANCTVNSFLVHSLPSLVHAVEVADRWFVVVAALAVMAMCVGRLLRASRPARARLAPVAVPVAAFAGAAASRAIALQSLAVEDPYNTALFAIFVVSSSALILLGLGLIFSVVRAQAERRVVERIVASLGDAPAPGELQAALSRALHDPGLRIAYWLDAAARYVDAEGRAVPEPAPAPGRTVTRLVEGERTVGLISHAGAAGELEGQIGPAIRLGLENERLQAEVLARLEELRASRTRIVETADRARIALERDLHDGAQQRLLAVSYDIRLAHSSAAAETDGAAAGALARAIEQTHDAIEELRELARGIFPAVLTEAGLTAALHTLADTASLPVEIDRVDDHRYPAAVEAAAYFAVAEAIDNAARRGADHAAVAVFRDDRRLVVMINDNGRQRSSPMVTLTDRVGALGGNVTPCENGRRVEIPCV